MAVFVAPSYETLAGTVDPSDDFSVQLALVIVAGSIARENVALMVAPGATPVAPAAGVNAVTVGGGASVSTRRSTK